MDMSQGNSIFSKAVRARRIISSKRSFNLQYAVPYTVHTLFEITHCALPYFKVSNIF